MSELVYQRLEHAKININDHVEQILFYARLQAAHVDYKLERVSLNHVLKMYCWNSNHCWMKKK